MLFFIALIFTAESLKDHEISNPSELIGCEIKNIKLKSEIINEDSSSKLAGNPIKKSDLVTEDNFKESEEELRQIKQKNVTQESIKKSLQTNLIEEKKEHKKCGKELQDIKNLVDRLKDEHYSVEEVVLTNEDNNSWTYIFRNPPLESISPSKNGTDQETLTKESSLQNNTRVTTGYMEQPESSYQGLVTNVQVINGEDVSLTKKTGLQKQVTDLFCEEMTPVIEEIIEKTVYVPCMNNSGEVILKNEEKGSEEEEGFYDRELGKIIEEYENREDGLKLNQNDEVNKSMNEEIISKEKKFANEKQEPKVETGILKANECLINGDFNTNGETVIAAQGINLSVDDFTQPATPEISENKTKKTEESTEINEVSPNNLPGKSINKHEMVFKQEHLPDNIPHIFSADLNVLINAANSVNLKKRMGKPDQAKPENPDFVKAVNEYNNVSTSISDSPTLPPEYFIQESWEEDSRKNEMKQSWCNWCWSWTPSFFKSFVRWWIRGWV